MLPPYGKSMRERRDRGDHPGMAFVHFVTKWRSPDDVTAGDTLVVLRSEYQPGKYDWSVLAGLWVTLVIADIFERDWLPLAIELSGVAAPVYLMPAIDAVWKPAVYLDEWMFCYREPIAGGRVRWPDGWSDELQADYRRRENELLTFMEYRQQEASA